MVSTALSVSVTRSAADVLSMAEQGRSPALLTIQFCSGVDGVGIGRHDHEPGLAGDLYEQIMDLLEVWLRHLEM
jgi:hypothetical protein